MSSNNDLKIKVGETAPDFELPDIDMKSHKLSAHRGRKVILAFFPAAESPVCTTEMCTFRDSLSDLKNDGTDIIGVSVDGPFLRQIGISIFLYLATTIAMLSTSMV